jgi:hypothetical protein
MLVWLFFQECGYGWHGADREIIEKEQTGTSNNRCLLEGSIKLLRNVIVTSSALSGYAVHLLLLSSYEPIFQGRKNTYLCWCGLPRLGYPLVLQLKK